MSSALLSVLVVCNRRKLRNRGKFSMSGTFVTEISVSNIKKINHSLTLYQNNVSGFYTYEFRV
jgi:hypothetical protein